MFLVATECPEEGGAEHALVTLWLVHTGQGSAMIHRSAFTDRARQLGLDDALPPRPRAAAAAPGPQGACRDLDQPGQPTALRRTGHRGPRGVGTGVPARLRAPRWRRDRSAAEGRAAPFLRRRRPAAPQNAAPRGGRGPGNACAHGAPDSEGRARPGRRPRPSAPVAALVSEPWDEPLAPVTPIAAAVDADPDLARPQDLAPAR
ncbi:hypothetical protein QJS66_08300 [Kocuria rhizophila]|nr:hypothetical protein QJS66_08300 [Kocuria rhizophila]